MHSLNNGPNAIWRYPSFEVVIAFDYYDGPESGLALYSSGEGFRFSSIGDSESRMQRAFEVDAIEGDWRAPIEVLRQREGIRVSQRVLVPKASEMLTALKRDVLRAASRMQYIAVGTPDLEELSMTPVDAAKLAELRQFDGASTGFLLARRLVRHRKSAEDGNRAPSKATGDM